MQWTKGSIDPEHVADKKIIVLDDPISSLDSTILYIVGAMIKDLSLSIRRGQGDVNQLFVLTHNVFFHKEASFIDGRNLEGIAYTIRDGYKSHELRRTIDILQKYTDDYMN